MILTLRCTGSVHQHLDTLIWFGFYFLVNYILDRCFEQKKYFLKNNSYHFFHLSTLSDGTVRVYRTAVKGGRREKLL